MIDITPRSFHALSLTLVSSLFSLLIACSPGESRVEQGNREGILHLGNASEPQTLDPHIHTGVPENHISMALFEGLVSGDPATLAPIPGMAERWEVSDDGLRYRFYIRENAMWSDGVPITAEDYVWSWERSLSPKMGNEYAYMLFILKNGEAFGTGKIDDFSQVGVKAVSERVLDVELESPAPYFLNLLNHHSLYVVPKHVVLAHGEMTDQYTKWIRPGNIVSNGAFKLKEWKIYNHVTLEKNPLYWDADNVKLNGVVYYPIENFSTEERMFRAGQLHKTYEIPLDKVPLYRSEQPELFVNNPYFGTYYYQFNLTRKPFDDSRVRHALSMAIDREAIANQVMHTVVNPGYTIVPPGVGGYQPPVLVEFNPEKGRQLLAEAGFPNGEGFPDVELLFNTNESHRKIAVAIQQMWKEHLNVDITLTNQEWKVYIDSRNRLDYDMARAGWIGDYVDPMNFLDLGLSTNGNNRSGYEVPSYDDRILNKIPYAKTAEDRLQEFFDAEVQLMTDLPFIPIYTYKTYYVIQPSVQNFSKNYLNYYYLKHVSLSE